jgi:sigma-B regulation protein RsbU (phosphoserine phosphatase)
LDLSGKVSDSSTIGGETDSALNVLVVDDSRAQRRMLAMHLARWGYAVTEAESGDEALARCRVGRFGLILSDWMMPGMTGLEFCRAFKALPQEDFGYFILLTSKSDKAEIADGLEAGADDFLTKPVSADELRARLRAGERILGMQREMVRKNRLLGEALAEIQNLYDSLDRDLIEARKLQQTLVRDRHRDFGSGAVSLILRPSGHVGGDLVGSFAINPRRIAVYSVDVSGHGVASAMMTARLAGMLSGASPDQNIALTSGQDGFRDAWPPEMVAWRLNRTMLEDLQVDQYFTMAYAEIDLVTGQCMLVQAGHPHPVVLRADGAMDLVGNGGLPIGLIDEASYQRATLRLRPGDRLMLVSDGITECPDTVGAELGAEGLLALLADLRWQPPPQLLESLVWALSERAGTADFRDDVSALVFDYRGAE